MRKGKTACGQGTAEMFDLGAFGSSRPNVKQGLDGKGTKMKKLMIAAAAMAAGVAFADVQSANIVG